MVFSRAKTRLCRIVPFVIDGILLDFAVAAVTIWQ